MSTRKRSSSARSTASKKVEKDVDDDAMDVSEDDNDEEEQEEPKASQRKSQPSRGAKSQSATPKKPQVSESSSSDDDKESSDDEVNTSGKSNTKKRGRRSTAAEDAEVTPAPKRPKKTSANTKKAKDEEEESLYESVKSKAGIATAVTDLLKTYKTSRIKGTLSLINFVVRTAGCTSTIDETDFESTAEEIQDLLKQKTKNDKDFNKLAKSNDYPVASKSKEMRRFRVNFSELWKKLIGQGGSALALDNYMMQHLLHWLEALCQCTLRPFRHTATLAALDLCSGLIELAKQTRLTRKGHEQLSRASGKSNKQVAESTQKSVDELSSKLKRIEELIGEIVTNVVNDRTRDISEEIRVECAKHIGKWIHDYSVLFLDNNYLRYLGWFLSDKSSAVRHAAVDSLLSIYADDDVLPQLERFSKYYKKRLVAMTLDKDATTACAVSELLSRFIKLNVLDEDDLQAICANIYDKDHRIREATGKFIAEVILESDVEHRLPAATKANKKKKSSEEEEQKTAQRLRLKSLVELIQQSEDQHPDVADFTVDAMWGKTDALTSWETMTDLLSARNSEDALQGAQTTVLARILLLCVRKAFGETVIEGGKASTDKEDVRNSNIQDYTLHLAKTLPGLLTLYSSNHDVCSYLVEIPRFFPLDAFASFRLKSNLEELMKHLADLFLRSANPEIFDHAARTFAYLSQEHPYQREVDAAFQGVVETSVRRFRESQDPVNRSRASASSRDSSEALLVATQRIDALAAYDKSLHRRDDALFGDVVSLLETRLEARAPRRKSSDASDVPEEVAVLCIEIAVHQLMWELTKVVSPQIGKTAKKQQKKKAPKRRAKQDESVAEEPSSVAPVDDEEDIPQSQFTQDDPKPGSEATAANKAAAIDKVEEMSRRLFKTLPVIFTDDISDMVREKAFRKVCWLLVAFTPALAQQDPSLAPIVYSCDSELASQLEAFYNQAMATPTETDEETDRKLELTQAFSAAIIKNVLSYRSFDYAPSVLVHFVQHGPIISEAIKTVLQQLREHFAEHGKDIIFGALQRSFQALQLAAAHLKKQKAVQDGAEGSNGKKKKGAKAGKKRKEPDSDEESGDEEEEDYSRLSRLAHRLSDSYGIRGNIKGALRESLYNVVLRGLRFALDDEKNRSRFISEAIMPFVAKLDSAAAGTVLKNIEPDRSIGRLFSALDENDDDLRPFFDLKDACARLSRGEKATPKKPAASGRGGAGSRAKRKLFDEEEEVDEISVDEEEDELPRTSRTSRASTPKTAAASRPRRSSSAKYTGLDSSNEESDQEDTGDAAEPADQEPDANSSVASSNHSPVTRKRNSSSAAAQDAASSPTARMRDRKQDQPDQESSRESVDRKRSAKTEIARKKSSAKASDDAEEEATQKRSKRPRASEMAPLYDSSGSPAPAAEEEDDEILEPVLSPPKRAKVASADSSAPSQNRRSTRNK